MKTILVRIVIVSVIIGIVGVSLRYIKNEANNNSLKYDSWGIAKDLPLRN